MGIAVGLMSGGLDSWLACLLMKRLGFEVHALHICSPFFGKKGEALQNLCSQAEDMGIKIIPLHVRDDYIEMLLNPKHGYGSCVNPCIDCHIYMFKMAKSYMERVGGQFVFTGEVINQRPMSQRKPTLMNIEKETGLEGYLLRPLSALHLEETVVEKQGIVPRDKLLGLHGRNRSKQFELAKEFGLKKYPGPGGGCTLTDPNYISRVESLKKLKHKPNWEDLELLRIGRHFRLTDDWRLIISRDSLDGDKLVNYCKDKITLSFDDAKGSFSALIPPQHVETHQVLGLSGDDPIVKLAASIASRYSKAYNLGHRNIPVLFSYNDKLIYKVDSEPMSEAAMQEFKI